MTVTLTLLIGKVIRPQGTRKHNHVYQNETKQAVALPPGFIKLNCYNEISPLSYRQTNYHEIKGVFDF